MSDFGQQDCIIYLKVAKRLDFYCSHHKLCGISQENYRLSPGEGSGEEYQGKNIRHRETKHCI